MRVTILWGIKRTKFPALESFVEVKKLLLQTFVSQKLTTLLKITSPQAGLEIIADHHWGWGIFHASSDDR